MGSIVKAVGTKSSRLDSPLPEGGPRLGYCSGQQAGWRPQCVQSSQFSSHPLGLSLPPPGPGLGTTSAINISNIPLPPPHWPRPSDLRQKSGDTRIPAGGGWGGCPPPKANQPGMPKGSS